MPLDTRVFTGRYFGLTLDGQLAGIVKSIDGGGIKGELIAQQVGGQPYRIKHINNPVIEPFTVSVGMTMTKGFYQWIEASWAGKCERRNGAITVYDANFKPQFEYTFNDALILETSFPALDGGGKEPGFMNVKFQAETATNNYAPSGGRPQHIENVVQKQFMGSNFRFELGDLETKWVNKIDAITVKQNVKPMACGPDWMYQLEATSLEFPNLTVYTSLAHAQGFYDWHKSFVIEGKNGPSEEKDGSITFLAPNLTTELLTIELFHVGILNIVQEKGDASGDPTIKRAKIELYVEEMKFKYEGGMK